MASRRTDLRESIGASGKFICLRSFLETAERLIAADRNVGRRLARRLNRIESGLERQREKLEATTRPLYRTRVDDDRRLIDEPLSGDLSGRIALLLLAHHQDAYRWAQSYKGDTASLAHAALLQALKDAKASEAGRQEELLSVAEVSPVYGAQFGSVLSRHDLDDLRIPMGIQAAILAAPASENGKGLRLTTRQRESVVRRYKARRRQPQRSSFIPAVDARQVPLCQYE